MTDELPPRPSAERRRDPRFNISMPVMFTVAATGRAYSATVDNISLGGLLLLTDTPAPLDDGARIVIHLPIAADMTMRVEAEMVRTTNVGEFAVSFVSLTESELDRLAYFFEQRDASGE